MRFLLFLLSAIVLASCEKAIIDLAEDTAKGNLIVSAHVNDQVSMGPWQSTKSTRPLSELCTRISYVLYQEGKRVKYVNQKQGDETFGSARISVPPGQYGLLIIGHSGASSATTTNLSKITFSSKVTDTFANYQEIDLTNEPQSVNTLLTRTVAMVRLNITGDIPGYASMLKFYYTGGSSSLDGVSLRGCVDSRQTEYREVSTTQKTYDIFTFPHETDDMLQITITAYDAEGNEVMARQFSDVPVSVNRITNISCDYFDGSSGAFVSVSATTMADDTWAGTIDYTGE